MHGRNIKINWLVL